MTDEEILAKLRKMFSDKLGVEPEEVTRGASLMNDLGADSLDMCEIPLLHLHEEFGFNFIVDEWEDVYTVGDVVELVKKKLGEPEQSKTTNMVLFFMTVGRKTPKVPKKPEPKFVMPRKPMMFTHGKKR